MTFKGKILFIAPRKPNVSRVSLQQFDNSYIRFWINQVKLTLVAQ